MASKKIGKPMGFKQAEKNFLIENQKSMEHGCNEGGKSDHLITAGLRKEALLTDRKFWSLVTTISYLRADLSGVFTQTDCFHNPPFS